MQANAPRARPAPDAPIMSRALHPDRERDPALLDRLRGMQRRLGSAVRKKQAALVRKDGYADLGRIVCPALVVACRQDRLRTFAETEHMAHCLPHARFEIIENCGHMAPLERPRELAALLADWVERDVLAAVRTA
jgi:pimeloyl-ACP methyl ester carboxylesterase